MWDSYFPSTDLDYLIGLYETNPDRFDSEVIRGHLITLYKMRDSEGRHNRARESMRSLYLILMSTILIVGIVILIALSNLNNDIKTWSVLVAGGMGAVLSRSFKMRELGRIVELKGAWLTLFPQMIIGATLALVVVVVLHSGIIDISIGNISLKSNDIKTVIIVSFVSGFSEPFALGILNKITND